MNTQWKPICEVDPAVLDKELKQLERLDVPLLHLEAILFYTPEKFNEASIQRRFEKLADEGILTATTLDHWLQFSLPDEVRKMLVAHLKTLRSQSPVAQSPTVRICCPVIIGYYSALLPGVTLGGVRWIEVVSRGPSADIASGFPEVWHNRLEELGKQVQEIVKVPLRGQYPHWRILDSFGRAVIESKSVAKGSQSLELGAALAYACWAMQLRLPYLVAATGKVSGDRIESIEDAKTKMLGLGREASHVGHVFVAPKDMAACSDAGISGTGVVPVHSLSQAITVLRRDSLRLTTQTLNSSSSVPLLKHTNRFWELLIASAIALSLAIGAVNIRWPSPDRRESRVGALYPHIDASASFDRIDALTSVPDAVLLPHTLVHDATLAESATVHDGGDEDLGDRRDVPVPCEYLAANGVCRIRMESPLFNGAWPPGLAGDIRWFVHRNSERYLLVMAMQGCDDALPTPFRVPNVAGVAHVIVPLVPSRRSRHCEFGTLQACLENTTSGFDLFCSSIRTITDSVGQRNCVTSIGTDGRTINIPAQACRPTDEVAVVEMGIDLSERSPRLLSDRQWGYRVTVRWSVRGVPVPIRLNSQLSDRTRGPSIEGLPESGEAVLDLPVRDGGSGAEPILVCIEGLTARHLRCQSLP